LTNEQCNIIVDYVIKRYIDNVYTKEDVLEALEYYDNIICNITYYCNDCKKEIRIEKHFHIDYSTYYRNYYRIVNKILKSEHDKVFYDTFNLKYDVILKNIYFKNTIKIFFDKTDPKTKKLFRIYDLSNELPSESGGDGNFYDIAVLSIVLSIVSAFLYDALKLGIKNAYKRIKTIFRKNIIKLRINKGGIKKHLMNENIKINQKLLQEIIEEKTMEIIDEYINKIEE
jgi:hypothetical protein